MYTEDLLEELEVGMFEESAVLEVDENGKEVMVEIAPEIDRG